MNYRRIQSICRKMIKEYRRNILPIFNPALLILFTLISCSRNDGIDLNRAEREYLSHKKEVVFVGETNYPPFEFIQKNGSYSGMSIELLRWIATEAGFNIEFIPMPHAGMQDYVLSGKADAVVGLFDSIERRKNFTLTIPYFKIPGTIFIKTERPDINSIDDLQGKRIAVLIEDYSEEWVRQNRIKGEFIRTADFSEAIKLVISGKADALIGDEQVVLFFLYSSGERNLFKKITPSLYDGQDCVAVSQNSPLLASILNKGIEYSIETGILKKISDKWLGVSIDPAQSFFRKFGFTIIAVSLILFLIILAAFFWIFILKREVTKRTADLELKIKTLTDTEKNLNDVVMRYNGIYNNTTDSIFWIKDENGSFIIENVNPAHEINSGIGNDMVAGNNIEEILSPEIAAPVIKNYRECMTKGEPVSYEEEVPLEGGNKFFFTLLVPILDENKKYSRIVGFSRDITASKSMENSVRHTQKLESLGVLAGGIAHDFNNLLLAIIGNIELTIYTFPGKGFQQQYLEKAILTSRRAADLCAQLLAYSGRGISEYKKLNINSLITEMLAILEVSVSKKTIFDIKLAGNLPGINADPSQIRQIVMNLVINASESLGESEGNVYLTTGKNYFKKSELTTAWTGEELNEGDYVWIEVSDNGCGMSEETLTHLFDPFFTTKFTGRGLGLSAVLGIVRGHKGTITVKSTPGKGSAFSVFFPASEQDDEIHEIHANETENPITGGIAMIVDDEEEVRKVTGSMLEICGFSVITSDNGHDALQKLSAIKNEKRESVRVILLDLTMPHMDGSETFRKIKEITPESRIILMSGYSEHDLSQKFADTGISGFLQKPFQLKDVKKKISEVLK